MLEHGDRWPHSLAVIRAADVLGPPYPSAYEFAPQAYRSLGGENRGSIAEALGEERAAIMGIGIAPFQLNLAPEVEAYVAMSRSVAPTVPKTVKQEATRMAQLIIERVKRGGELVAGRAPLRTAPGLAELYALLVRKWQVEQLGRCALCGGALPAASSNPMIQASADRIDSSNPAYSDENVQIAHLACNWAKNKHGLAEFEQWVRVIRGLSPDDL